MEYFDNPVIENSNNCFNSLTIRSFISKSFDCYLRMFKKVSFVKVMGLVEKTALIKPKTHCDSK